MRILLISPYLPYPPNFGSASRIYNLLRHVSRHHAVSFVCPWWEPDHDEDRLAPIKTLCKEVFLVPPNRPGWLWGRSGKRARQVRSVFSHRPYQYFEYHFSTMQEEIDHLLARHDFDIVEVEFPQMAYYRFTGEAKLLLSLHNIEHEIFYRTYVTEKNLGRKVYNGMEWLKFRRDEIRLCAKFDGLVTTSRRDADALRTHLPNHLLSVVPNGVDTDYFRPSGKEPDPHTLVFTGSIGYYPNTDAIIDFHRKILPLIWKRIPDVKLLIVGSNPPEEVRRLASDRVTVTGGVPDTRPYLERASVAVVPLRIGGGTRLKIAEAMAMGKPVVSTSIGCEGLDVVDGEHILIADEPADFAEKVVELLVRPEQRGILAEQGRELACTKYDWRVSATRLEETYERLTRPTPTMVGRQG